MRQSCTFLELLCKEMQHVVFLSIIYAITHDLVEMYSSVNVQGQKTVNVEL